MDIGIAIPILHFNLDNESIYDVEGFLLSNNSTILHERFFSEKVKANIGTLDYEMLLENVFLFYRGSIDDLPAFRHCNDYRGLMHSINNRFAGILSHLWFIKDNSVSTFQCYLHDYEQDVSFKDIRIVHNSCSVGKYTTVSFPKNEIEDWLRISNSVIEFRKTGNESLNKHVPQESSHPSNVSHINYIPYDKALGRVQRALRFLDYARSNSFLPQKISSYIVLLESLFTKGSTEVSHKVCERVAFYIGGNKDLKLNNFDLIKSAYEIRSNYVHGNILKKANLEYLAGISQKMDSLVRELLTKIILTDSETFSQNDDQLEKWFKNLLFN